MRLARFLLDSLCDEAVDGEICREGEDAVCGEVSEVISPENQMKRAGLVFMNFFCKLFLCNFF